MGKRKRKNKQAKKLAKKERPRRPLSGEARGFLLLGLALGLFLSMASFAYNAPPHNTLGLVGSLVGKTLFLLFGISAYLLVAFTTWVGWRLLFSKSANHVMLRFGYVMTAIISLSILLSWVEVSFPSIYQTLGSTFYHGVWQRGMHYHLGGAPSFYLYYDAPGWNLLHILNNAGVAILFTSTFTASAMFLAKIHPKRLLELLSRWGRVLQKVRIPLPKWERKPQRIVKVQTHSVNEDGPTPTTQEALMMEIEPEKMLTFRPTLSRKKKQEEEAPPFKTRDPIKDDEPSAASRRHAALNAQRIHNGDYATYKLPSATLLRAPERIDQSSLKQALRRQAEVLEETLLSFGIEAKVGQINCGPTINSFEVHPAIGVKVQKIKTLQNDIALNMEAQSIRIIAPIPGKAAVGIEVPNPNPQEVAFRELLQAYQKSNRKFNVPILLGKSVNGDLVMSDLTKMPHCIIAGATGSGKSVCINTIVMSIVMNAKPDEVRMIMVDPKKVELTPYNALPHMVAPVITEPQGAYAALQWLVKEMENRYELLKETGVRNIAAFNGRRRNKEAEEALDIEVPERLPYIVAIFDELADLMMVSSSDIETPIARIAQMARAVGIHLLLATQRPSREVITGIIKANFPTRISFKVASRVNSQIVLDETGAETLLGNGDMLFMPPGSSHLTRAQGAYIRDEDINAVIERICTQAPPNYIIDSFDKTSRRFSLEDGDDLFGNDEDAPKDSLYSDALDIVLGTGNASTTFLQRKLKIGYARAASLMDELESNGVVGPAEGSRQRTILINKNADEESAATIE